MSQHTLTHGVGTKVEYVMCTYWTNDIMIYFDIRLFRDQKREL
jgi:hypothetical protein